MRRAILLTVAAVLLPSALLAQERKLEAILSRHLFSPNMVMHHQRELDLTDGQLTTIKDRVEQFHSSILDLQWELERRSQALADLVSAERVDVEIALEHIDQVLELETRIKRNHLRLLIEIRNALSPEQQQMLQRYVGERSEGRTLPHP